VLALAGAAAAPADDFYVDPVLGSPAGDGSAANPWRTLQEVVEAGLIETRDWESHPYVPGLGFVIVNPGAPVGAGDTIWLRTGYHGELFLRGAYNAAPITIAAEPGHAPRLSSVLLQATQNWIVRGLSVSPRTPRRRSGPAPSSRSRATTGGAHPGTTRSRTARSSPSPTPRRGAPTNG